jgi:hypothetical protein
VAPTPVLHTEQAISSKNGIRCHDLVTGCNQISFCWRIRQAFALAYDVGKAPKQKNQVEVKNLSHADERSYPWSLRQLALAAAELAERWTRRNFAATNSN